MDNSVSPARLPHVERFTGVSLSPDGIVSFHYLAGDKPYELTMLLDQAFELEELFVKIRRSLGEAIPRGWRSQR